MFLSLSSYMCLSLSLKTHHFLLNPSKPTPIASHYQPPPPKQKINKTTSRCHHSYNNCHRHHNHNHDHQLPKSQPNHIPKPHNNITIHHQQLEKKKKKKNNPPKSQTQTKTHNLITTNNRKKKKKKKKKKNPPKSQTQTHNLITTNNWRKKKKNNHRERECVIAHQHCCLWPNPYPLVRRQVNRLDQSRVRWQSHGKRQCKWVA